MAKAHPSTEYAEWAIGDTPETPVYVKKQCKDFLSLVNDESDKYMVDWSVVKKIDAILKIMIMPKGLKAGQSVYECSEGYQWMIYVASLAVVRRSDIRRRRYETILLEICRKNFKTYTVATVIILLFLIEPPLSQFYSVAPDGALSREVKDAIANTLRMSPLLYEYAGQKRFKILRDYIEFSINHSKYTPLNYSTSRMDGRLGNVFVADEVGALPSPYPIEAMRSGQLNILNKLGFIISTKYPTSQNPFEDEVAYAKKILDGAVDDETYFSLLYEPDNTKDWATDDLILKQSNPVALNSEEIWADLLKKRARAIEVESARENFVTKHCNIIYQGVGTESYVSIEQVQACRTEHIDWSGRVVYVGVDLAMTSDNCSVVMCAVDEDENIISLPMVFIPEGRVDEKSRFEKFDYRQAIQRGECIACGDMTVDYGVIEKYVFDLEDKYGVSIQALGYDRYQALSSAQKWEEKYTTVEVRQHSDTLHMPTKFLKEMILNQKFRYESNRLYEVNFENARCTYDTGMRSYVNKKKSTGKVDACMATIDAIYLLQQDIIFGDDGFVIQTI